MPSFVGLFISVKSKLGKNTMSYRVWQIQTDNSPNTYQNNNETLNKEYPEMYKICSAASSFVLLIYLLQNDQLCTHTRYMLFYHYMHLPIEFHLLPCVYDTVVCWYIIGMSGADGYKHFLIGWWLSWPGHNYSCPLSAV